MEFAHFKFARACFPSCQLLACLLHNLNNSTRFLIIFIICRPKNNRRKRGEVRIKPGEVRIFTTEQLAAIVPPGKFLRVVASKTIVYEVDKNEYFNPHGVGPYFGEIINPFGLEKEVHWADDDQTMTSTSYLGVAVQIGEEFEFEGKIYKCFKISEEGLHCKVIKLKAAKSTAESKTSAVNKAKAPAEKTTTEKTSAVNKTKTSAEKTSTAKTSSVNEGFGLGSALYISGSAHKEKTSTEKTSAVNKAKASTEKTSAVNKEKASTEKTSAVNKAEASAEKTSAVKKAEASAEKKSMYLGKTNIKLVDKQAFAKHLELAEQAEHIRKNAAELDSTKYAGTDTCAYEQARNLQIEAHKCYMLAIGLGSNQLDKEIAKKPKAKKKTKKTTKITVRTNPPRGAKNANNGDPNDAAPAAEIGEQTKESDIAWIKCRDPPLESAELLKLKPALKRLEGSQYWQPRFSRAKYYAFAHRVCRAYRQVWLKQKSDPAHLNRENLARSAVASVFGQVRPWTDKPHHGNTHMAMLTLLPAIEMVFDIPSYDHNPGTKQWLKKMVTTNRSVMRVHFCSGCEAGLMLFMNCHTCLPGTRSTIVLSIRNS